MGLFKSMLRAMTVEEVDSMRLLSILEDITETHIQIIEDRPADYKNMRSIYYSHNGIKAKEHLIEMLKHILHEEGFSVAVKRKLSKAMVEEAINNIYTMYQTADNQDRSNRYRERKKNLI